MADYDVAQYAADLRMITAAETDDKAKLQRIVPLARKLAATPDLIKPQHYERDADQGVGVHLLHEEDDHSLAVFVISWEPGRHVPPHNHNSWAVVVGLEGEEHNVCWRRKDDGSKEGYAELERDTDSFMTRGDFIAMLPAEIHSVHNEADTVALSLHTYGMHINYSGRSQFDLEAKTELPIVLKVD